MIVVEDADSPTPVPLLHLIAWAPGGDGELSTGALGAERPEAPTGVNSFHQRGWLPPDPPRGHGPHRYLVQVFSLDALPSFSDAPPHKGAVIKAIEGHVLAMGSMVGVYARN